MQVFVARAPIDDAPPGPGRFRKYHEGAFSQPGLGGEEAPAFSSDAYDQSHADQVHVVFSPYLDRYVMTVCIDHWKRRMGTPGADEDHPSGISFAFSRDGIDWSEPHRLFVDWCLPRVGGSVSWEPSLLFDDDEDGSSGWLLYGYSESWGASSLVRTPHHMAGRRIRFTMRR